MATTVSAPITRMSCGGTGSGLAAADVWRAATVSDFGEGKAGHQLDGRFVGRGGLIDVSRFGMERDAEMVEELLAAGAVGGQYDFQGRSLAR